MYRRCVLAKTADLWPFAARYIPLCHLVSCHSLAVLSNKAMKTVEQGRGWRLHPCLSSSGFESDLWPFADHPHSLSSRFPSLLRISTRKDRISVLSHQMLWILCLILVWKPSVLCESHPAITTPLHILSNILFMQEKPVNQTWWSSRRPLTGRAVTAEGIYVVMSAPDRYVCF